MSALIYDVYYLAKVNFALKKSWVKSFLVLSIEYFLLFIVTNFCRNNVLKISQLKSQSFVKVRLYLFNLNNIKIRKERANQSKNLFPP